MKHYEEKKTLRDKIEQFNNNSLDIKACFYFDIDEDIYKLILYLAQDQENEGNKNEVIKICKGDYNETNAKITELLMLKKVIPITQERPIHKEL